MNIAQIAGLHGRVLRAGQIWQSNDPRRLRAVRVVQFLEHPQDEFDVVVENVQTGKQSIIDARNFTVGQRGWSLMKEVQTDGSLDLSVRGNQSHPVHSYIEGALRQV